MRFRWPSRLLLLALPVQLAWGWTCPQSISTPSCGLWQSPTDNNEVADQESLVDSSQLRAETKLGQTFRVGGSGSQTLYRLDVILGNREDQRSGVLKIWAWKDSYPETVLQTALFTEVVDLTGREKNQLKSFYPRIAVEGGREYLFEFDSTGREPIVVVSGPDASYANGQAYVNGTAANSDLWFRTFLPPVGAPLLPTFASSDSEVAWTDPLFNPAPVTKEDYYARVKNLADNQRCDGLKGCGAGSKQAALYGAFLLRTCPSHGNCESEDYLGNVVAMLKRADGWFRCTTLEDGCNGGPCGACEAELSDWGSMEKASLAYLWIRPKWGSVSPADHIQIRNMFFDSARSLWPQRQLGTHNRALGAALTYRMALTIAALPDPGPGMPDPTPQELSDWEAYASSVWNDIWNNRDAEEDSENYSINELFRYFLEYTSVAGNESMVWSDPEFLKWVDRVYQQFTPLGVAPDYGHGVGWADQNSAPIWLFEKAAAMTGQSKYKWLAHRIFQHTRDRVCECAPPCPWRPPPGGACPQACFVNQSRYGDAFFNDMASIAGAYLAADDTIPDTVPGAQVETAGAAQTVESDTVRTGTSIGQTFRITESPLVRIDLKIADNRGSSSPATLKVWTWRGTHSATVDPNHVPLYQEKVKMDAAYLGTSQSFFPFLDGLSTSDTYFFEVSRATRPFGVAGSSGATDRYADGQLYANSVPSPNADLWFASYSLSKNGSTYTTRQHWVRRPLSEWGSPPKVLDIQPGVIVPDKLILRSGYDESSMHAVFNLVAGWYGHGEAEPGALASLIDRGSVLMTQTAFPYWHYSYQDEDESMAMFRRYWGGTNGPPGDRTTVTRFHDYRRATVAWIDWNDIHGWQVAQQRRFYFVKDRFLLVRDRYRFPSAMKAAIGPVWHVADVRSEHGSNWFDIYNRQPLGNVYEVRNPERYALLYFVEREEATVGEFREPYYGPGPGCTVQPVAECEVLKAVYSKHDDCRSAPQYVAYHRRILDSTVNHSVWFDTLIWPHDGRLPASEFARRVKKKYDDGTAVALEVRVPVAGAGDEIWTIVDNPDRTTISAGTDLLTDARYLVARRAAGAPASNYLLATEATRVRVGVASDPERIDYTWAVRNSVELGGN